MSSATEIPSSEPEGLSSEQDSATPSLICGACRHVIVEPYYEINRTVVCDSCSRSIEDQLRGGSGFGRFLRATAYGVFAASLGVVFYSAFQVFFQYDSSLVSILIGYVVGKSIRKGSGGLGGTAYQLLAVMLTYSALGMTYFTVTFLAFLQQNKVAGPFPISPGIILSILNSTFLMPVFLMKASPIHIAIVGFALWEAWKLNRPGRFVVTGPHAVEASGAPAIS